MIDVTTKKPIRVSTNSTAGPYIMVPAVQLEAIERLLTSRGVRYWADEASISLNGAPAITFINLGRGGDAAATQAILDGVE